MRNEEPSSENKTLDYIGIFPKTSLFSVKLYSNSKITAKIHKIIIFDIINI